MMTSDLSDILRDMEDGVYDFTQAGECSNCGQCCSNFIPISAKDIKVIHRYIKKKDIHMQKHILPIRTALIDMTCPFRDNTHKVCVIYPVRPAICRDFRCDKPKKRIHADKALYHGKYRVVDMREEFFGGADDET